LGSRLARVAASATEIARQESATVAAPTRAELIALRRAAEACARARALLDASAITLEITAEAPLEIEADAARKLAAGETATTRGAPEVSIRIRGVGRVRASGPVESGGSPRDRLARAEAELRAIAQPFGTEDVEALERLAEARERRERAIESARREQQ